jgi:hypothetical protein
LKCARGQTADDVHRNSLYKLLIKEKKFVPQAVHFLPWDYTILDTARFDEFLQILKKVNETDPEFHELLLQGLVQREENEANISFLIEEIVVTHLIREQMISFPKTLVKKDTFRLVVYPGTNFEADRYQYENNLLPKNENCINPYRAAHYDFSEKVLIDYESSSNIIPTMLEPLASRYRYDRWLGRFQFTLMKTIKLLLR